MKITKLFGLAVAWSPIRALLINWDVVESARLGRVCTMAYSQQSLIRTAQLNEAVFSLLNNPERWITRLVGR